MKKILLTAAFGLGLAALGGAAEVDHKLWDSILKANVDADGYVDYAAIRINRGGDIYQYLTFLETADVKTLSEGEKAVFWLNAYNAHVVKFMLANGQVKKANEISDVHDRKFKIARLTLSLNDIKNRIVRSDPPAANLSLADYHPNFLFALSDGSVGGPKLLNRTYFAAGIEDRLQSNAIAFVNNPNHIRVEDGRLVLSELFKNYAADFEKMGGLVAFLDSLVDSVNRPDAEDLKSSLSAQSVAEARYQYDWTVNNIALKK